MIPTATIAWTIACALVAVAAPFAAYALLRRRYAMRLLPFALGALTFCVFALVLEQLLHTAMMSSAPIWGAISAHWWLYVLYGCFAAGIFEETGRLCAFLLLRRRRVEGLGAALSYGLGHGWLEAVLVCAAPMLWGLVAALFDQGGAAASAEAANRMLNTPAAMYAASALERLIAVAAHTALSVLVWLAASGRGSGGLYFLSILLHAAINVPAAMYQSGVLSNIWVVEGITLLLVLVVCVVAAFVYEKCSQTYTSLLRYEPPGQVR